MNADLELVVRREPALFTPSYHVTVASVSPMNVLEAFDFQTREGLTVAARIAMEQLRLRGYRLTCPMEEHGTYASGHVAIDGQETATVVLAGDLMRDVRSLVRVLPAIDTCAGAQEVVRLVAGLMAGAQALQARADAVLHSDARVESAAILDDAITTVTEAEGLR